MRLPVHFVIAIVCSLCAVCVCATGGADGDGEGEETKTGGGYAQFLSAVVDKKYIEDHLSGTVDWRRSATYSEKLAAVGPEQYMKFKKAQHSEDIDLYQRFFRGKEKGLILESGAFDGYNVSTTLFFEKFAGWNAIHVEADPGNFKKLSENRQNSINVHMALCDEPRILHYVDTGITLAHGIAEFMPDKFLRMHHAYLFRNRTRINDLREIPCFPIKYLFRHLKVREIDIWVLDTEGSELAVLSGVNFNRMKIKVIIMECDHHDHGKDMQKQDYLRQRGYQCSQRGVTCFCNFTNTTMSVRKPVLHPGGVANAAGGSKRLPKQNQRTAEQKQQLRQKRQQANRAKKGSAAGGDGGGGEMTGSSFTEV